MSIPLDVETLFDVDLDWGLDIAIINNRITINLITFRKGLSLVKIELFTFKKDNEGCDKDAWVYLPNLYQKKIITCIIINETEILIMKFKKSFFFIPLVQSTINSFFSSYLKIV